MFTLFHVPALFLLFFNSKKALEGVLLQARMELQEYLKSYQTFLVLFSHRYHFRSQKMTFQYQANKSHHHTSFLKVQYKKAKSFQVYMPDGLKSPF